jgi:hypothetical protein
VHFVVPTRPNERLLVPSLGELVPVASANRERLDAAGVSIGGTPLGELRARLRRWVLELCKCDADDGRPLIATGHQPSLPHPGVLYKQDVLNRVGREAVGINIVVESDTLETLSVKVPARRGNAVTIARIAMARTPRRMVLAHAPKPDRRPFEAQLSEVRRTAARLNCDEILDALDRFAAIHREEYPEHESLAAMLTAYRRRYFPTPLVHEVPLTNLCRTDEFRAFAAALIQDAAAFLATHNSALNAHRRARRIRTRVNPFPDLRRDGARIEVPLWHLDDEGLRSPVYVETEGKTTRLLAYRTAVGEFRTRDELDELLPTVQLRPKALTLTMFIRLCVADLFIHGVSGGNYDQATDAIIRDSLGLEPPAYGVASLTARLPLDFDDGLDTRVRELAYRVRRMTWNPDEFVPDSNALRLEKRRVLAEAGSRLTRDEHQQIESVRQRLLGTIAEERQATEEALAQARRALEDQQRLGARDFPYFLYPLPVLQAAMAAETPCVG